MCRFRKRPKTLEHHPRAPAPATSHAVDRRRMSYAFQRGNYARDRREARRRERDGDASTVLADARALRELIENQRGAADDATADAGAGAGAVVAKTPEKNGVVDRDLAIGCLRELDGIEEALREDAARDARAEADDATKDEELMEMQAARRLETAIRAWMNSLMRRNGRLRRRRGRCERERWCARSRRRWSARWSSSRIFIRRLCNWRACITRWDA